MNELEFKQPEIEEKGWGSELIIHNDEQYCVKLLRFKKGGKGSFHYHIKKSETWYLLKGKCKVSTITPEWGTKVKFDFLPGQVIHLSCGVPHQVFAEEDSIIVEASTPHSDNDVYRIAPGDSQK